MRRILILIAMFATSPSAHADILPNRPPQPKLPRQRPVIPQPNNPPPPIQQPPTFPESPPAETPPKPNESPDSQMNWQRTTIAGIAISAAIASAGVLIARRIALRVPEPEVSIGES